MTKRYKKGDKVFIRASRASAGSGTSTVNRHHPKWSSMPVHECVIAQVDVCGLEGCYGLEWASDGQPIGLPFWATCFVDGSGNPLEN